MNKFVTLKISSKTGTMTVTGTDNPSSIDPEQRRIMRVVNDQQNNCGICFLSDNGPDKNGYNFRNGDVFKEAHDTQTLQPKACLWLFKMGTFYLLASSEKEECVQTDSEFSLFKASNELLNINAEGVEEEEEEKTDQVDLAAQAAQAEQDTVKKFARIIIVKS